MGLKENIKLYRTKCNLTLEEVAKQLGVSKPTVQRYESGVIQNIPPDKIKQLSLIFNVTPSELLNWDEELNQGGKLADEVMLFEQIESTFGSGAAELIEFFSQLNKMGRDKASEYVSDLSEQTKYLKNEK